MNRLIVLLFALALEPVLVTRATAGAEFPGFWKSTSEAVEQAHEVLWNQRVDRHGVILDNLGEIPTPEDCKLGRPNAIGWWSPIEDGPMFTGLYLPAACERARRSSNETDKANARRLAQGLLKCASVSDVPGMIVRGMGTDGKCHYPLGSDDQTHPWFYGLHAYFTSGIPTEMERKQIADKMKTVADVLQSTSWRCPCDGAFKGQFRGGFQGHLFRDAARYLFMLRAMHDVTHDKVWLERYRKAAAECPQGSEKTRAEICAAGFGPDRELIKNLEDHAFWIYVGSQGSLAKLAAMETDESLCSQYRTGLAINAKNALATIGAHKQFDNNDTKVFGQANWREVFVPWQPQKTQADAEKQSKVADKAKRGERKHYETKYMRNPLAGAAIIALAGDGKDRDAVERTIRHYDYSKLYRSEFSFAECAYYALPVGQSHGSHSAVAPANSTATETSHRIEAAHREIWKRFMHPKGLLFDFAPLDGSVVLPTPDECVQGKPNAFSWNTPVANCCMFSGLYLPTLCKRWQQTGDAKARDEARQVASGLMQLSEVSDVPGFIARAVGTDGRCHYPCGSDDQTHPWFYGLYAYVRSGIPDSAEKSRIVRRMTEVASALEANGWRCPCDGMFKGRSRGILGLSSDFRSTARHLFILRAMALITGEPHWQAAYDAAVRTVPKNADKSAIEICAGGYPADIPRMKGLDTGSPLWIFIGAQASLRELADTETNTARQLLYLKGLTAGAIQAAKTLELFHEFDNRSDSSFPLHEWRRLLNPLWKEQKTIEDTEHLDKVQRPMSGPRRNSEHQCVQIPMASALMIALSGDRDIIARSRPTMEAAFCHYDWSRLNMSFFFFAECAYYALPLKSQETP
jgi:hypothetical protein